MIFLKLKTTLIKLAKKDFPEPGGPLRKITILLGRLFRFGLCKMFSIYKQKLNFLCLSKILCKKYKLTGMIFVFTFESVFIFGFLSFL